MQIGLHSRGVPVMIVISLDVSRLYLSKTTNARVENKAQQPCSVSCKSLVQKIMVMIIQSGRIGVFLLYFVQK